MIKNILFKRLIAWALCLLLTPVWGAERTTYYHLDLLGSPVAATDSSGQVVWREEYKPYGERTLGQDPNTGAPGYTGKVHEEALGLSYYGARWYDPELGRFTGMDPAGFQEANIQSFNRYAYANNNPYRFVDQDGRSAALALCINPATCVFAIGFTVATIWAITSKDNTDLAGVLFNENAGGDTKEPNSKTGTVDDLLKGTVPEDNSKSPKSNKRRDLEGGGIDGANKKFDEVRPKNVKDRGDGVRTGELDDGTIITVRPKSEPTISIKLPGDKKPIKIRF